MIFPLIFAVFGYHPSLTIVKAIFTNAELRKDTMEIRIDTKRHILESSLAATLAGIAGVTRSEAGDEDILILEMKTWEPGKVQAAGDSAARHPRGRQSGP